MRSSKWAVTIVLLYILAGILVKMPTTVKLTKLIVEGTSDSSRIVKLMGLDSLMSVSSGELKLLEHKLLESGQFTQVKLILDRGGQLFVTVKEWDKVLGRLDDSTYVSPDGGIFISSRKYECPYIRTDMEFDNVPMPIYRLLKYFEGKVDSLNVTSDSINVWLTDGTELVFSWYTIDDGLTIWTNLCKQGIKVRYLDLRYPGIGVER